LSPENEDFDIDSFLRILRRVFQVFCGLFIVLCAVLVIVLGPSWPSVVGVVDYLGLAVICGILALVAAGIRQWRVFRAPEDPPRSLSEELALEDVAEWGARIELEQAELFCNLILDPATFFLRIAESATPMEGHTLLSSKLTAELPAGLLSKGVMLPVLVKDRGVLTDGLKIFDGDGHRTSSVATRQQVGFLGAVCRHYVTAAGDQALFEAYRDTAESGVVRILTAQQPVDGVDFLEVIAALDALTIRAKDPSRIQVLALFLRELRTRVPLLVELTESTPNLSTPIGSLVRITVDQDIALTDRDWIGDTGAKRFPRIRRWFLNARFLVMVVFGVKANEILIPVDNADRCQSYHLQCKGLPDVAYLGDQHLDRVNDGSSRRIKARRGQSYSHLYIQEGKEYSGLYFQNSFYEIPPGSTGLAVAVAFAALFGLWLLGWHQLKWTEDTQLGTATVLLGLPGAIAAFLGFGRTAGFLRGSFRARLSTIVSLITALVGLTSVALASRSTPYASDLMARDLAMLPPIFIFWLVLLGTQSVNLVATVCLWLYRAFIYWTAKTSYH